MNDKNNNPAAPSPASHATPEKLVRITRQDDYEKRWIVVGKLGAVDFHCSLPHLEVTRLYGRTGGVEYHHRSPARYMREDYGCTHDNCWVLGGKCWHDGTSQWASSHWIPLLEACGEDAIWIELEITYRNHEWTTESATEIVSEAGGSVPSEAQKESSSLRAEGHE